MNRPLHFVFEDRTAVVSDTDFDELYDRFFFRVARLSSSARTTTTIYQMNSRASRHRSSIEFNGRPVASLAFSENESFGSIAYRSETSVPMAQYLKKTSLFGGSLSRKFKGSDGIDYRWSYRTIQGQEWSCTNGENALIAYYALKPPNERVYDSSGNTLTILEQYRHLIIGRLAVPPLPGTP